MNVGTLSVSVLAITNQFSAGMADVRKQLQITGMATQGINANLGRLTQMMGTLGPAAVAASGMALGFIAVKAAVSDVLGTFAEFEHSMMRVKAIANASAADFDRLWEGAKQMSIGTSFSANEAALAMGELAQAGYNTDQILASLPGVMSLAASGEIEMKDAAEVATGALAAFNLEAHNMSGVADVLAKASIDSKTSVALLAESLKHVGPIANAAGMDIFEVVSILEALAERNVLGELGGTGLRRFMMDLAKPTAEAQVELNRLGIALRTVEGEFIGFDKIVDQFNEKLGNVGAADRLESLRTIFDVNAANAFAAAMGAGGDKLREFKDNLKLASTTSLAVMEEKLNSLTGESIKLDKAFSNLKITLGETGLAREFRALVEATTDAIQLFDGFLEHLGLVNKKATDTGGVVRAWANGWKFAILSVSRDIHSLLGNTEQVKFLEDAMRRLGQKKPIVRDEPTKIDQKTKLGSDGAALKALGGDIEDLAKRAAQITEAMRTPVEVFESKIAELNELVLQGLITWETYGRGVEDALEQVNRLVNAKARLDKPVSVGAVARGTTAGFSAERQAIEAARHAQQADATAQRQRAAIQGVLTQILQEQRAKKGGVELQVNQVSIR